MTYDAKLYAAMSALGLPIEPNLDTSSRPEYCAYYYDSSGTLYGDDGPCLEHRRWTLVYVAPVGQNRLAMRQKIRSAIYDLFGVYPSEDDATDASGQRYLYEFETVGAISDGET